ncbi:MAG: esterase-like activity of phytase family protein, partial [Thiotrichales bacterium]|nr:esterase-like activity of phytase family protein [Thiotrichales bacterium]
MSNIATLCCCLSLIVTSTAVSGLEMAKNLHTLSTEVLENHSKKGFQILGVIELRNVSLAGVIVSEFSGLAWDQDEQLLYAVSDQGYLVHLRPVLESGYLVDVDLVHIVKLADHSGAPLENELADS